MQNNADLKHEKFPEECKDAQKTDVKGRACQNIQNLQMCVPEIARV
jgi:hypothetical protein